MLEIQTYLLHYSPIRDEYNMADTSQEDHNLIGYKYDQPAYTLITTSEAMASPAVHLQRIRLLAGKFKA